MKKVLLSVFLASLIGLIGCGSDKPANNTPAPAPQDSGIKGPPPKDPSIGGKDVGGRSLPGGKK